MLKSLFLEKFAVLHLNLAGFLEVVQRSHTGGSLIAYMWDQWAKKSFFHIKFSATFWNYILVIFCMWIERWLLFMLNFGALLA